jgi:hypothetical protein
MLCFAWNAMLCVSRTISMDGDIVTRQDKDVGFLKWRDVGMTFPVLFSVGLIDLVELAREKDGSLLLMGTTSS